MKKIAIFILLGFCVTSFAQKKKSTPATKGNTIIATSGNASAEIAKDNFYLFIKNGATKDTMLLKTFKTKVTPMNCTIKTFTTKGTPMYLVSWTENNKTETKLKKEEETVTESQIWNPATKVLQIGNTYSSTMITEIVFLDKLKTASETQQKMRKSGYEFTFLDGDFLLKDKYSSTKYSYNPTSMKYEVAKGAAPTPTPPAKKKKR